MTILKAVILAGGRGERMRPITDVLPKSLVPIQGKPILYHQLTQLERLGVQEVVILTGYLAATVQEYCEGLDLHLKIRCLTSPPHFSPAERLIASKHIIGDNFLLLYCDNYVLNDEVVAQMMLSGMALTFLLERRDLGNVDTDSSGAARYYTGTRSETHKYVELGYLGIKDARFFEILTKLGDLPMTLEKFSDDIESGSIELLSPYWSLSNIERFRKLQSHRKIVLLDRDGVLNRKMPKRKYVAKWSDYSPIYDNWVALLELAETGVDFVVATNQPGVATGDVESTFLSEFHQKLVSDLMKFGVNILAVYVCPHHWDAKCECRKPRPGMLLTIMKDFDIRKDRTLYIGDDDRDMEAARLANIPGIFVGDEDSANCRYSGISEALPAINKLLNQVG